METRYRRKFSLQSENSLNFHFFNLLLRKLEYDVNDHEMDFISIGGLLPSLSPEDIRSGISQPRNKRLAEVFHRLHLIESCGTGIRKIYHLYNNCAVQLRIELTANTFKMILPNMNNNVEEVTGSDNVTISPQMQKILDYIDDSGQIMDQEVQELLGIKNTRAYTLMKQMEKENLIIISGRGVNKKYLKKK